VGARRTHKKNPRQPKCDLQTHILFDSSLDDDEDAESLASDLQVQQAVQKLAAAAAVKTAKIGDHTDKARSTSGGLLQRGMGVGEGGASGAPRNVDANGKSGTWVGDVFYSDDEEDGDENDSHPVCVVCVS